MNNQEFIEKILNKKFEKAIFSGYDAKDVDEFFDSVIEYLKQNDALVAQYCKIANDAKNECNRMQHENEILVSKNKNLLIQVQQYEADGYTNLVNGKVKK